MAQRYYPDQRYPPPDNQRFAPRGRSPVRYGAERHPSGSYAGGGPPRRGDDYSPSSRDWPPTSNARGVPRGPKAGFDTPRGRGNYPPPPAPRGRGFPARGDHRPGPGFYDREPLNEPRGPDSRSEQDRGWRQDNFERRESFSRPGPNPDFRESRDISARDFRARDDTFPLDEQHYDGPAGRGRGRGRYREDWAPRGRGRGIGRDDRGPSLPDNRAEYAWSRDASMHEPSYEPKESKFLDKRENDRSRDDRPDTFDPFTQDRAAARDNFPRHPRAPSRASSTASTPTSQKFNSRQSIDNPRSGPERARDESDLRRVASHGRPHDPPPSAPLSRRESLRPEMFPDSARERFKSGASSPPQAPSVPQYGSIVVSQPTTTPRYPPIEPKAAPQPHPLPPPTLAATKPPTAPTGPKALVAPPAAPTAPRAEAERLPPTAPRAPRGHEEPVAVHSRPPQYRQDAAPSRTSPVFQQNRTWIAPGQPAINKTLVASLSPPPPPAVPVPSGPRGSLGPTVHNGISSVPTGPKAIRAYEPLPPPSAPRAPTGPAAGGNWQRSYSQGSQQITGPTPTNSLPVKRDAYGQEKPRFPDAPRGPSSATFQNDARIHYDTPRDVDPRWQPGPVSIPAPSAAPKLEAPRSPPPLSPAWGDEPPEFEITTTENRDVKMRDAEKKNLPVAVLEIAKPDPVDAMDLDEEDYQRAEEQFLREKAKLEVDLIDVSTRYFRGATPLEVLSQLSYISLAPLPVEQADDLPQLTDGEDDSSAKNNAQTPEAYLVDTSDRIWIKREPSPITSPMLRSLPFLHKGPLLELSEVHEFLQNEARLKTDLQTMHLHFADMQVDKERVEEKLRLDFAQLYMLWIDQVEEFDRVERERVQQNEDITVVAPQVPLLDINPLLLVTGETRRRGGASSSEYDIAQAILLSERTFHQEDANRKKQAMSAKFDIGKECVVALIPEDYDPATGESFEEEEFMDARLLVQEEDELTQMALEPTPDDFTFEEHSIMISKFFDSPKKWGAIAEVLDGRNFKQCIVHYYASKWKADFKDSRLKPRPRVAKGKSKGGRTKANALMSNLGDSGNTDPYDADDYMSGIVAMTDRGRPRRAAAPTFGDKEVEETAQATPPTTGKKKTTEEKVGRKVKNGPKEKVTRRITSKPQLAAPRVSMSPEKVEMGYPTQAPPPPPQLYRNEPGMAWERQQLLMRWPHNESTDYDSTPYQQQVGYPTDHDMPATISANQPPRKTGMSSYWSVGEISQYKALVAEHGKNWDLIATYLGSKTVTMCKNYYTRLKEKSNPGADGKQSGVIMSPEPSLNGADNGNRPLLSLSDFNTPAHGSPENRQRDVDRFVVDRSREIQTGLPPGDFHGPDRQQIYSHGSPRTREAYAGKAGHVMEIVPPRAYASPPVSRAQVVSTFSGGWDEQRHSSGAPSYLQPTRQEQYMPPVSSFTSHDHQAIAATQRMHEDQRQAYLASRSTNETGFDQQRRFPSTDIPQQAQSNFAHAEQMPQPHPRSGPAAPISRQSSPRVERPPSAPVIALAVPPHQPKKSNVLSLLNSDEPSHRSQPPRTATPPRSSLAIPPQPIRPASNPPRYESTGDLMSSRSAELQTRGSLEVMRPALASNEPKINWSSRLGYQQASYQPQQSQQLQQHQPQPQQHHQPVWMENPSRPLVDQRRSALHALETRHVLSPPPSSSAYNQHSYGNWSGSMASQTESPAGQSLPRLTHQGSSAPDGILREPNIRAFVRASEEHESHTNLYGQPRERADELEFHQQVRQQPTPQRSDQPRSANKERERERPDAFMLHGSGYKSNSARRDNSIEGQRVRSLENKARDYRYDQQGDMDRDMQSMRMERERMQTNPFFQPSPAQQPQRHQQQQQQQQQRESLNYPPEHRNLGFGPVGQQHNQPPPPPPRN